MPVKFSLLDASGRPVTTAVASLTASGQAATSKDAETTGSTFVVHGRQYQYNLNTADLPAGSLVLVVTLDDSTSSSTTTRLW